MPQTEDALSIEAPPLRLTFRWDGLRWPHELAVGGVPIAASVEGDPGRDDPDRVVSPAYQQVQGGRTPDGGGQALLVGQWGRHHSSAVFTVKAGATGAVIEADVAVRTRAGLRALASTYTVYLTPGDLLDAGPNAITWGLGPPAAGRLRFEADGATRVGLAEAGRRATRVQVNAEIDPAVSTQRLFYRWCWLKDPARP